MHETAHSIVGWICSVRESGSAIWAVAFSVNTWASAMDRVRMDAYAHVREIVDGCLDDIQNRRWLDQIEKRQDSREKESCLRSLNGLLAYTRKLRRRYSAESCARKRLAKRVMGASAFLCVLCILFEWYYNGALALLLPYPLFRIGICLSEGWIRIRMFLWSKWVQLKFERVCGGASPEQVPSIDDLRKLLNER